MSSLCVHLYIVDKGLNAQLIAQKREDSCHWCDSTGRGLWLCLFTGCLKVGCDESSSNHSNAHNTQIPSHCIILNLTHLRAWCYMCELEVTNWIIGNLNTPLGQHLGSLINAPGVPLAQPVTPNESSAEETEEDFGVNEALKPKGLVGLRNLGLTCYMNAALQALSNSLPLASFMRDCPAFLHSDRRQPGIVRPFYRLTLDMWHEKRPSYVAPSNLIQAFRGLYPMFRSYTQQDSQEFLRYFMDQIHEELRQPYIPQPEPSADVEHDNSDDETSIENLSDDRDSLSEDDSQVSSHSDADEYETCDSGVSEEEESSASNKSSSAPTRRHAKRKRKHPFSKKWMGPSLANCDQDQSEFSDAMSETSLLDKRPRLESSSQRVNSSMTSGLGSSKPSITSFASSAVKSNSTPVKSHHSPPPPLGGKNPIMSKRRKSIRYKSIVSDTFDGVLVSSVQCLTCNTISSRKETFQDLSLPIPSSDQLNLLQHSPQQHFQQQHSTQQLQHQNQNLSNFYVVKKTCDVTGDGWMWWLWLWLRSWLWGPSVSLFHCLAAFFSADELKGDNMYSCDKCGKLRNGVKYSKVIQLPEILIIHLKRFRHEYMFSSKISQHVSFPLHGLDLSPFLYKDCSSSVRTYDLYSVICHHGAVGAGHYTAYAQNSSSNRWYEFDDQCVTQVDADTVANSEAYVLFYKKSSPEMISKRERTIELMQVSTREPSLMQFYVSKQWVNKFNTFAEPGPIDNSDFLCLHGGVQPIKTGYLADLVMLLSQGVWEYLHQSFGGGPPCTRLYECVTCREDLDALLKRQTLEYETFIHLHSRFQVMDNSNIVYAISMRWFCTWETFVRGRVHEPPGPVDNSSICVHKYGQHGPSLKTGSDYASISEDMWFFFLDIYGGGPELLVRYCVPQMDLRKESFSDEGGREVPSLISSKSLSTDNLPYRVIQEDVVGGRCCSSTLRQRTFSASDVRFTRDSFDRDSSKGSTLSL